MQLDYDLDTLFVKCGALVDGLRLAVQSNMKLSDSVLIDPVRAGSIGTGGSDIIGLGLELLKPSANQSLC